MMMPLAKRLLGSVCALLLTVVFSHTTEAGLYHAYGHGCGYNSYSTYYGGYGAYYGGYRGGYSVGYRGFGYGFYQPRYVSYGSASCGSACGSSCGYSCGSACGSSCDPCGVSYGGFSCGTCGIASCGGGCGVSGCGVATIGCTSGDCGTGIAPARGTTTPNQRYSPPATDQTYEPDDSAGSGGGGFEQPARRSSPPASGSGGSGNGELLPKDDGLFPPTDGGSEIDRGVFKPTGEKTIRQQTDHAPADAEPGDEDDDTEVPETPQDANIRPLDIETEVAASVTPDRRRARYSVRFHAPSVARLDVKPSSKWAPIDPGTKLAATK